MLAVVHSFITSIPAMYEVNQAGGWTNSGSEAIIRDVKRKVEQAGWSSVKAALDATIRYVIAAMVHTLVEFSYIHLFKEH